MVYQFGQLKFEPTYGPSDFSQEVGENFIEQQRLAGKPTIQNIGGILDTISFNFRFHNELINVRQAIADLKYMLRKKESASLINGYGFNEGEYVIDRLTINHRKTDAEGYILEADVSMQLKEFVSPDAEKDDNAAARKAGTANISANPIQFTPTVQFHTPESLCMRDIVATGAAGSTGSAAVKNAAKFQDRAVKFVQTAKRSLEKAKEGSEKAKNAVDGIAGKITNAAALKSSIESVGATTQSILDMIVDGDIPEPTLLNMQAASLVLDTNINVMLSTATQLVNVVILRK